MEERDWPMHRHMSGSFTCGFYPFPEIPRDVIAESRKGKGNFSFPEKGDDKTRACLANRAVSPVPR